MSEVYAARKFKICFTLIVQCVEQVKQTFGYLIKILIKYIDALFLFIYLTQTETQIYNKLAK